MALNRVGKHWQTYALYLAVTLTVMLPLMLPGYILSLDMVFTPHLRMPDTLTSSYPFYALLSILNHIVPSQLLEKVILLSIPLFASIGMHSLIMQLHRHRGLKTNWSIYVASVFFAINPYTYSRFMAGQYLVLLGYALLPWICSAGVRLLAKPNLMGSIRLGVLAAIVGAISIHTLGLMAVLGIVGLGIYAAKYRGQPVAYRSLLKYGVVAAGIFVVASGYWLVPLLAGQGRTVEIVDQFTGQDFTAFRTTGANLFNQTVHIARLQGLWAEGYNLFLMPQDIFPLWSLAVVVLWVAVGAGIFALWRQWRSLALWFIISMAAAGSLALGFPIEWLAGHIPALAGFREPHKFVGLLAFGYAILLAFGLPALMRFLERRQATLHTAMPVLLLILPVLLTPTMFLGFAGQLTPRHYPGDWFGLNTQLRADNDQFKTIFVPWHQYMSFQFSGRIIAHPAPQFFDKPVIVSDDPELRGATATNANSTARHIAAVLDNGPRSRNLGAKLAPYNVKYIVLTTELDYADYAYLDRQSDVRLIKQSDTFRLYRNTAWNKK